MYELFGIPFAIWLWRLALAVALFYAVVKAWNTWVDYVQTAYVENLKWTLLYIKLPRSAARSPYTMEMILNVLWQTGKTGQWIDLFWKGQVRPWHTLEMVSIEGKIYFFIRTYTEFADFLKSQIYAQFPDAEVSVVDDYVKYVPDVIAHSGEWDVLGYELKKEKDDKKNAVIPIKTYVDYGLDKPGKPEERIDPLANVIELMAALGPGEQYWIQIHIRAATARYGVAGDIYKTQDWKKEYAGVLAQYEEEVKTTVQAGLAKEVEFNKKRVTEMMSEFEKRNYEALQRQLSKNMFDVGIRCLYIAKKDVFRVPIHNGMGQVWRIFNQPGLNGLAQVAKTNPLAFDFPWDNVMDSGTRGRKERLYQSYIQRSYFYPPFDKYPNDNPSPVWYGSKQESRVQMLMSAEELATIFHFPGEEVASAQVSRVEARKAEPPPNLPIN